MLSREDLLLGAFTKDRLKDSDQRLLKLIIEVIFSVDRQVVLQGVERVLSLFVSFRVFSSIDHHVCYTVANIRC